MADRGRVALKTYHFIFQTHSGCIKITSQTRIASFNLQTWSQFTGKYKKLLNFISKELQYGFFKPKNTASTLGTDRQQSALQQLALAVADSVLAELVSLLVCFSFKTTPRTNLYIVRLIYKVVHIFKVVKSFLIHPALFTFIILKLSGLLS